MRMRRHKMDKEKAVSAQVLKIFDVIDLNGDGQLTKDEVIVSSERLNMTPAQASVFFDAMDKEGNGKLLKKVGVARMTRDEYVYMYVWEDGQTDGRNE